MTALTDIFYWVVNMSIFASVCGIVVMLLSKIKAMRRRFAYMLWAVPFLRMCLPFGIEGRFSLMSLLPRLAVRSIKVYDGDTVNISYVNAVQIADGYFPVTIQDNMLSRVFSVAALIWVIIAVSLIICMTSLYFITKSELRDAVPMGDGVYTSDKITSPAVYGIIRPKIIIPLSYKNNDSIEFILAHEREHIKNIDNLWRVVAFITAAVHWFNPLTWVFLKSFLAEAELFCDERVTSKLDDNGRRKYAAALLNAAEERSVFASAFGGAGIRVRLGRILSYKKMSVLSIIFTVVLLLFIAYALLFNATDLITMY